MKPQQTSSESLLMEAVFSPDRGRTYGRHLEILNSPDPKMWRRIDFPLEISLELTNYCNLRCVMCPNPSKKRHRGYMSDDLFKTIVNGLSGETGFLFLPQGFGEPLLHRDLFHSTTFASKSGIKPMVLLSNGMLLDEATLSGVMNTIDILIVTIDGVTDGTYESVRVVGNLRTTTHNIERFLLARGHGKPPCLVLRMIDMKETENEPHVISETFEKTLQVLLGISQEYKILIIDDGSSDETWETVSAISQHNHKIKMIRFSRNFGKEATVLAGLKFSKGQAAVVMDGDLQHPPALLPKMVHLWKEENYHVVHGVKTSRQKETAIKGLFVRLFYAAMTLLPGYNLRQATDFKLLDRRVVDHYIALSENVRFFRGLVPWLGFRNVSVSFSPDNRVAGNSKWSRFSLITLAVRAICSFSSLPMQVVTFMGGIMFIASILLGIQTLFMKLTGRAVEGFTTVILLLLFIGSILMISLGIMGQYLAMIYEEIKGRPPFIIEKMENL